MHEPELMSSVYRSVCSSKTDRRNNSNTPTAITHTLSILTAACMWGRKSGRVCRRNIEVGRSDGWEDSKEKEEDGVWVGKKGGRNNSWRGGEMKRCQMVKSHSEEMKWGAVKCWMFAFTQTFLRLCQGTQKSHNERADGRSVEICYEPFWKYLQIFLNRCFHSDVLAKVHFQLGWN